MAKDLHTLAILSVNYFFVFFELEQCKKNEKNCKNTIPNRTQAMSFTDLWRELSKRGQWPLAWPMSRFELINTFKPFLQGYPLDLGITWFFFLHIARGWQVNQHSLSGIFTLLIQDAQIFWIHNIPQAGWEASSGLHGINKWTLTYNLHFLNYSVSFRSHRTSMVSAMKMCFEIINDSTCMPSWGSFVDSQAFWKWYLYIYKQ